MSKLYSLFMVLFSVLFISSGLAQDKYSGPIHPASLSAPDSKILSGQVIGSNFDDLNGYFEEGFEGTTFPPANWQATSVLGAKVWTRITTTFNTGTACAFMDYETTGGEDWLITPKYLIGAGDSLRFFLKKKFTSNFPPDFLEIKVSTSDSALASFTINLQTIDVNTLTSITTWDRFAISLNAYAGQNIFIAFKHYDTDGNGVYMDDVVLGTPPPNDVGMFSIDMSSSVLPGTVVPTATVKNYGSVAQTFPVTMKIGTGYTSTKTVTALAPGTVVQVSFDNWAATVGTYNVTTYTALGGDINLTNDTLKKVVDCTTASWLTIANIPASTYMSAGGTIIKNDTTWMFSAGGNSTTKMEASKYNAVTNTWVTLPNMPVPRVVTSGCATNGKYYIIGGSDGAVTPLYQSTIYVLDLNTNAWTLSPTALPSIRGWIKTAAYQDSIIYIAGGYTGTTYLAEVLLYNVNTGTIRQATPLPVALFGGAFAISGNRMVYVGGADLAGIVGTTYVGTISQTDRSVITWTTGTAYPPGTRYRWDAGNWGTKGIIVAAGSPTSSWTGSNEAYYYNPITNTWVALPNKPTASLGSSVGSYQRANGDIRYVLASGYNGIAAITNGEAYADNFPVPVELIAFTASADHKSVTLNWSTATEINNSGFSIERMSSDKFEPIAFIQGKGTTTEVQNYSFVDQNITQGRYTYRLKQIDFDGSFEYSNLIEISVGMPTEFSLDQNYPNPFNPSTIISYQLPENSMVTLKVYDVIGNEITTLVNGSIEAGKHQVNFSAAGLSTGIYFYKLTAGNFVQTNKMLLIK